MKYFTVLVLVFYNRSTEPIQQLPIRTNLTRAVQILNSLCKAVEHNYYTGDICDWLCESKKNFTLVSFYEGSSKRVIKIKRFGKEIILKMHHAFIHEYNKIDYEINDLKFLEKVIDIINNYTQMDWPRRYKEHVIKMLWPVYKNNKSLSNSEKQSLWALLQQAEFISMRLLTATRILGSCGHVYQVEYIIPFKMKSYYMNLRTKILEHLMGTLKLFLEFINEPLQYCDVKFENFGLSTEYPRRFMVIDAKMLFTESKLNYEFSKKTCKNNNDCQIFDCLSKCDNLTGHCTSRLNDNLDVFCEKLIRQLFGLFPYKTNKYLLACHNKNMTSNERLSKLRYILAWNFFEM